MDATLSTTGLPESFLGELRRILGEANVRTGEAAALLDPGRHPANLDAGIVVQPGSTDEVARVVSACRRFGVPIVPHGGRTGLVGGGISAPGQVVLSLARMNRILRLDPVERVAVVEAGIALEVLQAATREHGLDPGVDLPARGSATIGGMVSTNAGGLMAFRNGVTRHRIFGIEAVLADGTVFSDLTRVVKNAAGYDLKHLFIGGEGTLGIVTRVAIKLDPVPKANATAFFALPSVAAVLDTIRLALDMSDGQLRAAEAMWRPFIEVTAAEAGWRDPNVALDAPIYLLLLLGGREEAGLQANVEDIFAAAAERHPGLNGLIATSGRQQADLWRLREDTDLVYRRYPASPSFDISLPQSEIDAYVEGMTMALSAVDPTLNPLVFGHLADGNLHIILDRAGALFDAALLERVEDAIYAGIAERGGSFSAEHGIGTKRLRALGATADPVKLRLMALVKRSLDPDGLLNPGKVVPAATRP